LNISQLKMFLKEFMLKRLANQDVEELCRDSTWPLIHRVEP